jgi:predicted DNA-binding transcriptional regulator YafY
MPKEDNAKTMRETFELLQILPEPTQAGATVDRLLELGNESFGWNIGARTLQRRLVTLEALGMAMRDEDKRANRWRADSVRNLAHARMPIAESLAFNLLASVARNLQPPEVVQSLGPRLEAARARLASHRRVQQEARWAEKIIAVAAGFGLQPPSIDQGVLNAVQDGLYKEQIIEISYRAASRERESQYLIEPRGIVVKDYLTYLVATRHDQSAHEPRWYRLDRVRSAVFTGTAIRSSQFNFQKFMAEGGAEFGSPPAPITLRAWVDKTLGDSLKETPLSPDQCLESSPDGNGYLVTCSLHQGWHFEEWVLGRGERIRIIEPLELKQKTEQRLRQALDLYQSDGS